MKNAKLLIPAIAVLALSSAAAVTGTVAWFTASRTVSLKSTAVTVVNAEGALHVEKGTGPFIGSDVTGSKDALTIKHDQLRDASMNILTGKCYGSILDETGHASAKFRELVNLTDTGTVDGKAVYGASMYKLKFTMNDNLGSNKFGLFLDTTKNVTTTADAQHDTQLAISNALRVGIVCGTTKLVYAPSVDRTLAAQTANHTYVQDADNVVQYVEGNVAADGTMTKVYNQTKQGVNFINEFDSSNASTGFEVTVYTWFEGTDLDCNDDALTAKNTDTFVIPLNFNAVQFTGK